MGIEALTRPPQPPCRDSLSISFPRSSPTSTRSRTGTHNKLPQALDPTPSRTGPQKMRPHRTLAPRSKSACLGRPPTPLPPGRCSGRNRSFRVFSPAQGPPSQSQICPSICPSRCLKCVEDARCKHHIAQPPCSCLCPPGHSHCASPHARGPFRNTLFARLEGKLSRHAPRNFRHAGMPRLRCPSPPLSLLPLVPT